MPSYRAAERAVRNRRFRARRARTMQRPHHLPGDTKIARDAPAEMIFSTAWPMSIWPIETAGLLGRRGIWDGRCLRRCVSIQSIQPRRRHKLRRRLRHRVAACCSMGRRRRRQRHDGNRLDASAGRRLHRAAGEQLLKQGDDRHDQQRADERRADDRQYLGEIGLGRHGRAREYAGIGRQIVAVAARRCFAIAGEI